MADLKLQSAKVIRYLRSFAIAVQFCKSSCIAVYGVDRRGFRVLATQHKRVDLVTSQSFFHHETDVSCRVVRVQKYEACSIVSGLFLSGLYCGGYWWRKDGSEDGLGKGFAIMH
jgi:hypothetical protein